MGLEHSGTMGLMRQNGTGTQRARDTMGLGHSETGTRCPRTQWDRDTVGQDTSGQGQSGLGHSETGTGTEWPRTQWDRTRLDRDKVGWDTVRLGHNGLGHSWTRTQRDWDTMEQGHKGIRTSHRDRSFTKYLRDQMQCSNLKEGCSTV